MISRGVLLGSAVLAPVVAPIASVIALLRDRKSGNSRMRETRIVALVAAMVFIDFISQIILFGVWLQGPFGRNRHSARMQNQYRLSMTWYTAMITATISRLAPLPLDTSNLDEELLGGNAIVIGRHRSVFDAVMPSVVFGGRGLTALYVMKDDLQWDPNLDVVGEFMGHVFVNRISKDLESELEPIRDLARRIDDDSVGVIFPEGTFFNQKRLTRAVASIERRDPERYELARKFRHLLPPRPAGTLAMLEAAPEADVIMLGHVGMEPFGSIQDILQNLGDPNHSFTIKAWRFDRSTVPTAPDEQIDWLFERWLEMDAWIDSYHPLPAQLPSPTN